MFFKGVGTAAGVVSAGLSVYGAYNYYSNGGKNADVFIKASLDTAFGLVGTFGGPVGLGISAAYFILNASTGGFGGFGANK